MEMDIIEANGNCAMASTWHTWANYGGDCDIGGCASLESIGGVIHIKATFSEDGFMSVSINGEDNDNYSPFPSSAAQDQVVEVISGSVALE